jgi:dihydroorotate dehydrogenase (fumarate)
MADLTTTIGGVQLPSYVFNASGPKDVTLDELRIIGNSAAGAIMMKSCTLEPRNGNEEPRYAFLKAPYGSINSMGLPNLGYKEYVKFSGTLKKEFPGKPVIASLAGMGPEDYPVLVKALQNSDADILEVNLSCPNVKGKPQIGYDFDQSDAILKSIMSLGKKPLGVKLPPYFDFVHFEQMAMVLKRYPLAFVACINSLGNTLVIDPETESPVIKPKGGFGGLGGEYVKPVALANVRAFSQLLGDKMAIIGVGGVRTGTDAFEFLLAGADAVQVGTAFYEEGPECFGRIQSELAALLDRKKYANITSAKGKLKVL